MIKFRLLATRRRENTRHYMPARELRQAVTRHVSDHETLVHRREQRLAWRRTPQAGGVRGCSAEVRERKLTTAGNTALQSET